MSRIPDIFVLNELDQVGILLSLYSNCLRFIRVVRVAASHRASDGENAAELHCFALRRLVLFVMVMLLAGCGPSKSELDAEVRRLCAIDGGLKVFERVLLAPNQYDDLMKKGVRVKANAASSDDYFVELDDEIIVGGNPRLLRHRYRYIQRSNGKVIAQLIVYGRGGGDSFGPWQDSSFSCPEPTQVTKPELKIFERG